LLPASVHVENCLAPVLTFDAIDGVESVLGFCASAVNSRSFIVSIKPLRSQSLTDGDGGKT
jgi:hypothetical protein